MNQPNFKETVLRQSYVFNTGNSNVNRSFISTAIINDSLSYGDDLRKSRIQNLPNYKKTSLGDNIQFIVVFQTIEIQRLSQEIEVLRVRLKENQRQLFNAQNYQVQIRQLTERCFMQERQIEEYRDQCQKLNKICETIYHENEMLKNQLSEMDFSLKQKYESEKNKNQQLTQQLEKWKSRYQACEKSKAKQLEDLRNMMDSQRKSMIDRQIREMSIRFQNQRSNLENEIRKCRQMVQNRNMQLNEYKQRCQKYEITIMQLQNYQNIINDHESKLHLLNNELLRLNEILNEKQEELQRQKQRQYKLNQQIKEQKEWEYENKQLKNVLETKSRESQDWRVRCSRLEEEIVRAKELEHYNEELGNKLNLAAKELDRLNHILKNKMEEIEQWKRRLVEKESEVSKYKNLQNEIHAYESKINNSKIENDRINGILKSRLSQIEEWKQKYNSSQQQNNQLGIVQKQKRSLQEKLSNYMKNMEEMKNFHNKLESENTSLRRNEIIIKDHERNNQNLNKENQRLNSLLKNHINQLNDLKIRYTKTESIISEYKNIEIKQKDYENKIKLLTIELEKLNDLLKDRNKELSILEKEKLELYSKINYYKNYQIKITQNQQNLFRAQEHNAKLKAEIQTWHNKFRDAENKFRDFQNINYKKDQEKEKINSMLKNKNNQMEELRNQYMKIQGEMRRKNQLQIYTQEQNNHIMGLMADIDGYERRLKSLEHDLEKQKAFTNQFAFKIIVLSSEIQRLSNDGGSGGKAMKSKEYQDLQESHSRLQSKVQTKNSEMDMLISKITSLQSKITQMMSDYSRILSEAQRSQNQTKILAKQIQEYQDYARRIHILNAEIDRLRQENKNFDEDIKRMRLKYSQNINSEKREELTHLQTFLMAVEIESLRRRVDEREINVEELRKSILEPVRRI